jgi:hypothetical protein
MKKSTYFLTAFVLFLVTLGIYLFGNPDWKYDVVIALLCLAFFLGTFAEIWIAFRPVKADASIRNVRAKIGLLVLVILALLVFTTDNRELNWPLFSFFEWYIILAVCSKLICLIFARITKPVAFYIDGNTLVKNGRYRSYYDATLLMGISKKYNFSPQKVYLNFEDSREVEFDGGLFKMEEVTHFLNLLIEKSEYTVEVHPDIQHKYGLLKEDEGDRTGPDIYEQFADEPFDLADFDAISVRWREAGMTYLLAVKLVREKTGMSLAEARDTVDRSAGWSN